MFVLLIAIVQMSNKQLLWTIKTLYSEAVLKKVEFCGIIYYRWALAQPKQPCGKDSMRFLLLNAKQDNIDTCKTGVSYA